MRGFQTHLSCANIAGCIKDGGFDFVLRYYSRTTRLPEKRLTPEEATAIAAEGLPFVIVYQDANNKPAHFSRAEGKLDGLYAHDYAVGLHQPQGSAIYVAVDYDATSGQIASVIAEYFIGIREAFEQKSGGDPLYKIGVYGSGATCAWLRAHLPFVEYGWLALATGWRDYGTYTDWNLKQFKGSAELCGIAAKDWQENHTQGEFGHFTLPLD